MRISSFTALACHLIKKQLERRVFWLVGRWPAYHGKHTPETVFMYKSTLSRDFISHNIVPSLCPWLLDFRRKKPQSRSIRGDIG